MPSPKQSLWYLLSFIVLVVVGGCGQPAKKPTSPVCFRCDPEGCHLAPEAEPQADGPGGLFDQGEIDLTGDGRPERVQRLGDQVVIYQDDVEVWRSPPPWRVVDVALGDPNDDGRNEILLAFWKQDEVGVWRSHPFIVGYRGGHYYELWGGSAVDAPIGQVELGDVDGDRVQELIVLEQAGDERSIVVWRWNQWWFNVVWRGPPAGYRDLWLATSPDLEQPPTLCVSRDKD